MKSESSGGRIRRDRKPGLPCVVAIVIGLSLSGWLGPACFSDAVNVELVYPYRLLGADSLEAACVVYHPDHHVAAVRIPAVVTAVGWNERYLVASNRPVGDPGGELSYYYIDMDKDHVGGVTDSVVAGPMSKSEFDSAGKELGLPALSLEFPELR